MPAWIRGRSSESPTAAVDTINRALRKVPVWLLYVFGPLPALWLFALGVADRLGPEPVEVLLHRYGLWGFQFLLASLAITPLRRFAGLNLLRFRRALGLLAFLHVLLHLAVWLLLDVQLDGAEIRKGLTERPFIMLGMAGFAILLPLALTSTDAALRRLGAARWAALHRLAYLAVILAAVHFLLATKTWQAAPILHAVAVAILLGARLFRPTGRRRASA